MHKNWFWMIGPAKCRKAEIFMHIIIICIYMQLFALTKPVIKYLIDIDRQILYLFIANLKKKIKIAYSKAYGL